jgi:hypothetical protein
VDAREQLESLRQINLTQLPPEAAQQAWDRLLTFCAELVGSLEALGTAPAAGQKQPRGRDQLPRGERRRKGKGKGKGTGPNPPPPAAPAAAPAVSPPQRSSEAERREAEGRKPWRKGGKNAFLEIDAERYLGGLDGEPGALPPGAKFLRYEPVIIQDLILLRWNTRFWRARYSLPEGGSQLVPLPPGYSGQFGPGVKTLALSLNSAAQVTIPLLERFFQQAGVRVSRGQVSRFLTEGLEDLVAEMEAAVRAAVAQQPWLQIDDTRSGVRTEHGCCHVLGNDLATFYVTTDTGDRRSVIEALMLGAPLTYRLEPRAFAVMERWGVPLYVREWLAAQAESAPTSEREFTRWLDRRFPTLGTEPRQDVLTAAALAGYHAQSEVPVVQSLLSDDAALFRGLADEHALCWVHDFGHYLELEPRWAMHERQFARYKKRYWKLYRGLLEYKEAPTEREAARLEAEFDRLVDAQKAPQFLAECLARTRKNKQKLLLVLKHPDLPLHNNAMELAVRWRVRKRDVSFGPVSAAGRRAWDTLQSLRGTVEKVGVSFWSFLHDRIHETGNIPPLPELIAQKATQLPYPNSWAAT